MNRWQQVRQVKALLVAATWEDSSRVFTDAAVRVTHTPSEEVAKRMTLPLCLIVAGGTRIDPDFGEMSSRIVTDVTLSLVTTNRADPWGEASLLGANRRSASHGRGLLEVEERVNNVLVTLGPASGLPIIFRGSSMAATTPHPSIGAVAQCTYHYDAHGTTYKTWQPPSGLVATGGSGQVALTWNASRRFDFLRFILRYAAGATPPASSSSGTGVTLSSDSATSVTVTGLSTGTYSFALFIAYDDVGAGSVIATSDAQTWVSVTVT